MKKIILMLTFVLTMFCGIFAIDAKEIEVTNASLDKNSVDVSTSEEKITITLTSDTVIKTGWLTYCNSSDIDNCEYKNRISLDAISFVSNGSNTYSAEFTIGQKTKPANFTLKYMSLEGENFDDYAYLSIYDGTAEEQLLQSLNLTVANTSYVADTDLPEVKSINFASDVDFTAPGSVRLELEITDENAENIDYNISYADEENISVSGTPIFKVGGLVSLTNKTTGIIVAEIDLVSKYKKEYFWYVSVVDDSGNLVYYTYDVAGLTTYLNDPSANVKELPMPKQDLNLIPKNYLKDTTTPKLLGYEYNKETVITGSSLSIKFDIKDDESGLDFNPGHAKVKNADGTYEYETYLYYDESTGNYLTNLWINPGDVTGKIHISEIYVYDIAGNEKKFTVGKDFTKKEVTVKDDTTAYDLETTTDNDYVTEVSALKDRQTAYIDMANNQKIKKELFEAIKGKDITVTFGYSPDGESYIEFIINGKDVTEIKDVDLETYISGNGEDSHKYFLDEYVFPKFELDNSLSPEEALNKLNKEKEKELEKYYDYLKKLGFKNTDKMKKKAIEFLKENGTINTAGPDLSLEDIIIHSAFDYMRINMKFKDNGTLPGKMKIRLFPVVRFTDKYSFAPVNVYDVDTNKGEYSLNKIAKDLKVQSDDTYEFTVKSLSGEYWLIDEDFDKNNDFVSPPTGDNINISIMFMISSLLVLGASTIYLKRIKNN